MRIALALLAAALTTTAAHAGSGYQQCNADQCYGSDSRGNDWSSQRFGDRENNTTFYSDNRGERCVQQCFGGACFTNCD